MRCARPSTVSTRSPDAVHRPGTAGAGTVTTTSASAPPSTGATRAVATAQPAGPTQERLPAVQAIAKPQTDDSGDDEYSTASWAAGFFRKPSSS